MFLPKRREAAPQKPLSFTSLQKPFTAESIIDVMARFVIHERQRPASSGRADFAFGVQPYSGSKISCGPSVQLAIVVTPQDVGVTHGFHLVSKGWNGPSHSPPDHAHKAHTVNERVIAPTIHTRASLRRDGGRSGTVAAVRIPVRSTPSIRPAPTTSTRFISTLHYRKPRPEHERKENQADSVCKVHRAVHQKP
jgi:hypothetical protein